MRFVKLHFEDAEMEPAGVPALLAYQGGDKFAGLVPMVDEIPDDADLSAGTLETVLKRYVILLHPILVVSQSQLKRQAPNLAMTSTCITSKSLSCLHAYRLGDPPCLADSRLL